MDDLISRQAAIDVLATMQGRCTSKAALIQNSKIWQQIKDLPSAQPTAEPVRHGKWANDAMGVLRCSECNAQAPWKYGKDYIDYRWKANYCPNCGARMDAERKEEWTK